MEQYSQNNICKLKYKNRRIILRYCSYKNFTWYAIKKHGYIILFVNNNYDKKLKSKILHKIISNKKAPNSIEAVFI